MAPRKHDVSVNIINTAGSIISHVPDIFGFPDLPVCTAGLGATRIWLYSRNFTLFGKRFTPVKRDPIASISKNANCTSKSVLAGRVRGGWAFVVEIPWGQRRCTHRCM